MILLLVKNLIKLHKLNFVLLSILAYSTASSQNPLNYNLKKFPEKFRFIDFNNDSVITQNEVDFVVNSRLDNVAKYSPAILDEFVIYLDKVKKDSTYTESISSAKIENTTSVTITPNLIEEEFEPIVTDRPDQTEAPNLTPKGWFQIEAGAQKEFDETKEYKAESTLFNTTLWKYGLTNSFEFRLITEFGEDKLISKDTLFQSSTISGFNPVAVGCKIKIHEGRRLIPSVSLISHLDLPLIGSDDYKPTFTIPRFRFCFAHDLTEKIAFSYNVGAEWEEAASNATYIYTGSLGFSIGERMGAFIECYGFLRENSPADNRLDGGITYQITDNLQLDTSGGIGISELSPDYFLSAGISWRFNAFDKKRTFQGKLKNR